MTDDKMTLAAYAIPRECVVLYWAGVGCPVGTLAIVGHPDLDFPERNNLFDLAGTIDDEGQWQWDGEGDPTDDSANTIYRLTAYVDRETWQEMVAEYESDVR